MLGHLKGEAHFVMFIVRVIIYFTISNLSNYVNHKNCLMELPPIQVVLTKCDLYIQDDLARRVVQVREQLSDILRREPKSLSVMLVSAKAGIGYNNTRDGIAKGGVVEMQRELAALVTYPAKKDISK